MFVSVRLYYNAPWRIALDLCDTEMTRQNTGVVLLRQIVRCRQIDKRLSERIGMTVDEMHCLAVLYLDRPSCVKKLSEMLDLSGTRIDRIDRPRKPVMD